MLASYGSFLLPSLWNVPVAALHDSAMNDYQVSSENKNFTNGLAATEDLDRFMWHGQLQLRLSATSRAVFVHVVRARYLQLPLDSGFSTYVEVRIASKHEPTRTIHSLRSKSVENSVSPEFDDKFSFKLSRGRHHARVYVELYMQRTGLLEDVLYPHPICNHYWSLITNALPVPCSRCNEDLLLGGMSFGVQRLTRVSDQAHQTEKPELFAPHGQPSVNSSGSFSTKSQSDHYDSGHIGRPPHRSLSYPLEPIPNNENSCASWYYLFDRPSSYSYHMLALDKLQYPVHSMSDSKSIVSSSNGVDELTVDSAVADTSRLNSLDSRSTVCSVLESAIGNHGDDEILRFLIPYSEEGYGFTLAVVDHTASNRTGHYHSTSTPSTSPEAVNRAHKPPTHPSNICIHAVRRSSPADQVNLPVGAYLVEVGHVPLDPGTTLKGAVKCLRQASKLRSDKSMPLGVILMHRVNPPVPRPVMNGVSKTDDCLSVISSISGASNDPNHCAQITQSPTQDASELINSPLATSFRSLSISASSSVWSGPAIYPNHGSLHRSGPVGVNEGSSLTAETTSLRSFGLFPMSSTCAVLCEERCIDPDTSGPTDGESSLQRRKRLLTLAPPVLHLRWCDVTPQEARRQWAIAALLSELKRVASELLAGVRAYLLGLRRTANLTNGELDLLFRNIPQVASQAGQLVQRLQGSCLAYASAPKTHHISTPARSQSGIKSFPKMSVGNAIKTMPILAETRKPNIFTRIRKSIVGNPRIARNGSASIAPTETESSSNTSQPELLQSNTDHQPTPLEEVTGVPPSHGHLDSPGRIVQGSIGALLAEYAVYTHGHLTRMKQVREFRRKHPELRPLLRVRTKTSDTIFHFYQCISYAVQYGVHTVSSYPYIYIYIYITFSSTRLTQWHLSHRLRTFLLYLWNFS
ncbi:hypothetical protein FGIG_05796 [Fasciola gigantica]|uniref:C2 domain-containing protein n=1 Tax=Fasciola gigantica TaxID=46835 RepID=A0A504Z3S3_FASGI|nr:hypothetical protein FGIG_05796 [Fasciola gigantica]